MDLRSGFGSGFGSSFDSDLEAGFDSDLRSSLDSDFEAGLQARRHYPIPEIKKKKMDEEEIPIVKDDPLEDLLLKDSELFNDYAKDLAAVNMKKIRRDILTDDYLSRFEAVWPKFSNKQRKARCIKFLEQNPGMRTMDPQVLWQRIFYYHVDYPNRARRLFPARSKPILHTREALGDEEEIGLPKIE